jgi:hypothetical protein
MTVMTGDQSENSSEKAAASLLESLKAVDYRSTDSIKKAKKDFEDEGYGSVDDEEDVDEEDDLNFVSTLIPDKLDNTSNSPTGDAPTGDAMAGILDSSSKSPNNILDRSRKSPKVDAPSATDDA